MQPIIRALPFLALFSFFLSPISAQNIEWEENLGTSGYDLGESIISTSDGGYIGVGTTNLDIRIWKLDGAGNVEWDTVYGGSDTDVGQCVIETDDNGFMVGAYSQSTGGDLAGNHGNSDYWVVMLDSSGAIQREKTYGGSDDERGAYIRQTMDGGFAIFGGSSSDDQDVSENQGSFDHWLLKIDPNGSIEWEANYGGSGDDVGASLEQTSDGGFILGGKSASSDGDLSGNMGSKDAWFFKVGAQGTSLPDGASRERIFSLHPNPTSQRVRIGLGTNTQKALATVRDLTGRTVRTKTAENTTSFRLKLAEEPGIYMVEIRTDDGRRAMKKVVKE